MKTNHRHLALAQFPQPFFTLLIGASLKIACRDSRLYQFPARLRAFWSPVGRLRQAPFHRKLASLAVSLLLWLVISSAGLTTARAVDVYVGVAGASFNTAQIIKYTPPALDGVFATGFASADGLAFDAANNLYVADSVNGTISKITPSGGGTTFASGLNIPMGLAFDSQGNLYEVDNGTGSVNKFSPTGVKSTFASGLNDPRGVAVDSQNNVYVTDGGPTSSTAVFKYAPDGTRSTFASVQCPIGIAIDSANNVYVSQGTRCVSIGGPPFPIDILKFTPAGSSTVFTTAVTGPTSLAVDPAGNLYVSDTTDFGSGAVYIFAPNGARTVLASGVEPEGIAVARSGAPSSGQLLNISTRLNVLTGDQVLIGGFIITGTTPKKVIVRAIGPSLAAFGVMGSLADPILELHMPDSSVVTNDNWRSTQEQEIIDSNLAPTDDLESAIIATLPPGGYTAIVSGNNGGTGVGLVEAYDLDSAAGSLANISTRGFVDTGDNVMIGGFIVGSADATVLVRAIGPSLTAFGVPGALQDPTLELHDSDGNTLTSNDDWKATQQAEIEATGLAPSDDRESAILATLPPGGYTAIVRGALDTTGVGLVEVYHLQ
jgi:hypothetical protein